MFTRSGGKKKIARNNKITRSIIQQPSPNHPAKRPVWSGGHVKNLDNSTILQEPKKEILKNS